MWGRGEASRDFGFPLLNKLSVPYIGGNPSHKAHFIDLATLTTGHVRAIGIVTIDHMHL